jgi:hypothetical protein
MIEALVVLVISALVGATMCAALIAQSRVVRAIGERVAFNDAARTTLHILPAEIRALDPLRDVRAAGADSIAGRWIRSTGVVCAADATALWVRLRGMRQPDPAKDSMLVMTGSGEEAYTLQGIAPDPAGCEAQTGVDPEDEVFRVALAAIPSAGAVAVFETGTYYLSQRALRYRVGAEGRQPLTEEFFMDAGSGLAITPPDSMGIVRLRLTVALRRGEQQRASTGRTEVLTVLLPNAQADN